MIKTGRAARTRRPGACLAVGLLAVSLGVGSQVSSTRVVADVSPGCVVDTTGIIGWWRGQEDLLAVTGPELTGTVGFADGMVGRGMVFDGTNTVGSDLLAPVTDAITVEMWVKPSTTTFTGLTQALASRWDFPSTDDSARVFELLLDPYGNLVWSTDETSSRRPAELRVPAPQFQDGGFHHVATTWDQTTITIYIDGVLAASMPSQGGTLNPGPLTAFRLGSELGRGSSLQFKGMLDEATIWSRVLTAAEVATIHGAGFSGKCTFVPLEQAKLTGDSTIANDRFGSSLAVDGTTFVAGAPYASVFAGEAYVYTRPGLNWGQQGGALRASDAARPDFFGNAVDVDGDTIVVGAYGSNTGFTDAGAAYVFTRTGTTWTQQAKLVASDPNPNDQFGYSVAVDGDTVVVGSLYADGGSALDSGAAYVFTRTGTVWTQEAKLTASDAASADVFGTSLSIEGDSVVVGAPGDDDGGTNSGSAYAFTRAAGTWSQQGKLLAADGAAGDFFGYSVSLSGDTVLVGAPFDDDLGTDSGSAYVDTRTAGVWSQYTKLVASNGAANSRFGYSVGYDGLSLIVGAPSTPQAAVESGAAYSFTKLGGIWTELTILVSADIAAFDNFGSSVAVAGSIVIGANLDDNPGNNSGSAYVFAS